MQRDGLIVGAVMAITLAGALFVVRQNLAQSEKRSGAEEPTPDLHASERPPVPYTVPAMQYPPHVADAMRRLPNVTDGLTLERDGFLGAKSAISPDGRQLIAFAWFRDEASMSRWFENRLRKDILRPLFPNLANVRPQFYGPRRTHSPVMVVGTLTPDPMGRVGKKGFPASQASFEVYSIASKPMAQGAPFAPGLAVALAPR
ncbi:MAG: hypothetical protein ACO1SV_07015 [Fimbriimonas sp.]